MDRRLLANCRFPHAPGSDGYLVILEGRIHEIGFGKKRDDFSGAEVMDMRGSWIFPGFTDTHTHFLHTGLHQDMVSLVECPSISQMLEKLREGRADSEWLRGYGYDESIFSEGRRPSRHDLDLVASRRPAVIFRRDYHSCVLNTAALSALNVPEALESRDVRDGFFRAGANDWVRQQVFRNISAAERKIALARACAMALSRGITTVHALEGGTLFGMEDLDFMVEYGESSPLRIILYPQITDVEWVRARRIPRIGGCILVDGSFGSRTAALSAPYHDQKENSGVLYFDNQSIFSFMERAHVNGLQLSFHAIGNRAIRQLLDCYERLLEKHPSVDHRHRIEHCELPDARDIERIARLRLYLAVQPAFETLWGGEGKMYASRLGPVRAARTNPLREFCDRGIPLAGGSDSDVTPMDPLLGIYAAVTHPTRRFRLPRQQALDLYTSSASKFAFQEHDTGLMREGMKADLAVLAHNPLEVKPEEIRNIEIKMTFIEGKLKFSR